MPIKHVNEGKYFKYEDEGSAKRFATMFFNKKLGQGHKWELNHCDIKLLQSPYSIEDWTFLKEIGEEIIRRLEELNNPPE